MVKKGRSTLNYGDGRMARKRGEWAREEDASLAHKSTHIEEFP